MISGAEVEQQLVQQQHVEEQKNKAETRQEQGNGNLNISPAIALLGGARTRNEQGNENEARSSTEQGNQVGQGQLGLQSQHSGNDSCGCKHDFGQVSRSISTRRS